MAFMKLVILLPLVAVNHIHLWYFCNVCTGPTHPISCLPTTTPPHNLNFPQPFVIFIISYIFTSGAAVVKVLDSKFEGCEFKTHTEHGSFSKLRQFHLPYFASVYSAANEYKHCLEGTCNGLVSRPGESV